MIKLICFSLYDPKILAENESSGIVPASIEIKVLFFNCSLFLVLYYIPFVAFPTIGPGRIEDSVPNLSLEFWPDFQSQSGKLESVCGPCRWLFNRSHWNSIMANWNQELINHRNLLKRFCLFVSCFAVTRENVKRNSWVTLFLNLREMLWGKTEEKNVTYATLSNTK